MLDSLIMVAVKNSEKELVQKLSQDIFSYVQDISEINEYLDFEVTLFDTSAEGEAPAVSMIIKGHQHREGSSKTTTTDSVKTSVGITERESFTDSSTTHNYTKNNELFTTNETVHKENKRNAGWAGWVFLGICIAGSIIIAIQVIKVKLRK